MKIYSVDRGSWKATLGVGGHTDLVIPEAVDGDLTGQHVIIGFFGSSGVNLGSGSGDSGVSGMFMTGYLNLTADDWIDKLHNEPISEELREERRQRLEGVRGRKESMICELLVCPKEALQLYRLAVKMKKKPPIFTIAGWNCYTRACELLSGADILKSGMEWLDTPNNLSGMLEDQGGRCYPGYTEVDESGHAHVEEIGSDEWMKAASFDNFQRLDALLFGGRGFGGTR